MKYKFIAIMEKRLKRVIDDRLIGDRDLLLMCASNSQYLELLLKRHFGLMFSIFSKAHLIYKHIDPDDMWSACYNGLIWSVDHFDPYKCTDDKGVYHYLRRTIIGACIEVSKNTAKQSSGVVGIDETHADQTTDKKVSLADVLTTGETHEQLYICSKTLQALTQCMDLLNEETKFVVQMRSEGESIDAIANVLGKSRQIINIRYNQALNKIKDNMKVRGYDHNTIEIHRFQSTHLTIPTRIKKDRDRDQHK
jgi:DNA-directed RNA polymerase specialized sigma subunit